MMANLLLGLRFVGSGIRRLFWWLVNHPYTMVVLVTAAISGMAVGHWMRNKYETQIAALEADLGRFRAADEIRMQRIKDLEASSAKAGDVLDRQRDDTARQLSGMAEKYSQALVLDRGKQQTLICPQPVLPRDPNAPPAPPPAPIKVALDEEGRVVCDRFPPSFAITVNDSIALLQRQLAGAP